VWEWLQVGLVLLTIGWTTLCLGGFLAETMVITSACNGTLLAVHFFARALTRGEPHSAGGSSRCFHPAGWWLLPFLLFAAVNVQFITPVTWLGWMDWLAWAQLTLVFWVVLNGVRSDAARLTLLAGIVAIGIAQVVLAAYQSFIAHDWLMLGREQAAQFYGRSSGSFGSPNSLAAYFILILPILGVLTCRPGASAVQRFAFGYLTLALGFGLILTISRGAWLALLVVAIATPLLAVRGAWWKRLLITAALGCFLGLLGLALVNRSSLVRDRLTQLTENLGERSRPILWQAAGNIFRDHPVVGAGAGSYSARFDAYRPDHFQLEPRWVHNEYLNTLSEYGMLGATLIFGAWGFITWRSAVRGRGALETNSLDRAIAIGGTMGCAAFVLQMTVDFNLKIPALALAFAAVAALVVQRVWPVPTVAMSAVGWSQQKRLVLMTTGAAVVLATGLLVVPFYRAEGLRQTARKTIDDIGRHRLEASRERIERLKEQLRDATRLAPSNGQAWADLAYATAVSVRWQPERTIELGRQSETYADHALGCTKIIAEFWIRKGVALDMQGRWTEAGRAFVTALNLAPTRAGVWYQQAVHLARNPAQLEDAYAAAAFSLRLDPANPEAHALREQLRDLSRAP
jgi:O-antigen ligase